MHAFVKQNSPDGQRMIDKSVHKDSLESNPVSHALRDPVAYPETPNSLATSSIPSGLPRLRP